MSKQDRQGARTPADLERKYGFGKSFKEILGIADDARILAEKVQKTTTEISETINGINLRVEDLEIGLSAQFALTVEETEDETGEIKVFSLINGEATKIHFKSDSILIEATNFKLEEDGTVNIKKGNVGNCTFDGNGNLIVPTEFLSGTILAKQINADGIVASNVNLTGTITATEGYIGGWEIGDNGLINIGGISKMYVTPNKIGCEKATDTYRASAFLTDGELQIVAVGNSSAQTIPFATIQTNAGTYALTISDDGENYAVRVLKYT